MTESHRITTDLETTERRAEEYLPRQRETMAQGFTPEAEPPPSPPKERADIVRDQYSLDGHIHLLIRTGWKTPLAKQLKEMLLSLKNAKEKELQAWDAAQHEISAASLGR